MDFPTDSVIEDDEEMAPRSDGVPSWLMSQRKDPPRAVSTPLAVKLGATESSRCLVVGPAADAVLEVIPHAHRRPGRAPYDVIVAFCPDRRTLERHVENLPARLTPKGVLWLAWQKRASGIVTDVGEMDIHEAGLATGLVDNKVAAIDEVWSGFRFAHRRTPK